jgi:hypothetical protein
VSSGFPTKLRAALQNSRPSSRNLSAFVLDVQHYLEQTGLFSRIQSKKSGEPQCALLVRCQIRDPATSPSTVAEQLKRARVEAPLGYGGEYDAYEFQENSDSVQMDFVTVASYGVVVTGRIVVTGLRDNSQGARNAT